MKLVPKLLQGGFARFFSTYQPVFGELRSRLGSSAPAEKKEDESKSKLTEKDLYSMMKDLDGLPNEVQALVSSFTRTLELTNLLGGDTLDLATQYIRSLGQIKVALFNKSLYDAAYKEAEQNGALNDIAIDTSGAVIVLTPDGEIHRLTPQLYAQTKGSGEYVPVTNSNLLWLRAHNSSFINNNLVFLIIENGIGLDKIHKMIKDRFSKLGSVTDSQERFISKDIIKGNLLLEAAIMGGPDGFYKWKESLTLTDLNLVNAALLYIYLTLPDNAKTRLLLETQNGTPQEVIALIQNSLISSVDTRHETSFTYLGTASKNEGISNGSDEDDLDKMDSNMAIQFAMGIGFYSQIILNPGTPNGIVAYGVTVPVTDAEGKNLGALAPVSELTKGEFEGILDFNNITVGGKSISPSNINGILLKDGKLTSIDYPCQEIDGKVVPIVDPNIARAKNDADKEIAQKGIKLDSLDDIKNHYQEINDIYTRHGLDPAYNSNGKPIGNWRRFAVANVYTDDHILGMGIFDDNSLMREIKDKTERDNLIALFEDSDFDKTDLILWPFDSKNRMFEGTMWIPIDLSMTNVVSRTTKLGQVKELNDRSEEDNILSRSESNVNHMPDILN